MSSYMDDHERLVCGAMDFTIYLFFLKSRTENLRINRLSNVNGMHALF